MALCAQELSKMRYRPDSNVTRPECHAIFGDSIARGLVLPVLPNDSVINLSVGGNTWEKEVNRVHDHISQWTKEAANRCARPGKAFIWMGGNKAYGRPGPNLTKMGTWPCPHHVPTLCPHVPIRKDWCTVMQMVFRTGQNV